MHTFLVGDVGEYHAGLFVEESFAVELGECGQGGLDDGGCVGGRGGELDGAAVAVLLQVVAVAVGGEEDGDGLADAVLRAQWAAAEEANCRTDCSMSSRRSVMRAKVRLCMMDRCVAGR